MPTRSAPTNRPSAAPRARRPTSARPRDDQLRQRCRESLGPNNGVMTLYKAETAKITVTDGTLSNGAGVSVTVGLGHRRRLHASHPSTQTAATPFSETLTAIDSYGNTATTYRGSQSVIFTAPPARAAKRRRIPPRSASPPASEPPPPITLFNASAATTLTATQGSVTGSSGTSSSTRRAPPASASPPRRPRRRPAKQTTSRSPRPTPTATPTPATPLPRASPSAVPTRSAPTNRPSSSSSGTATRTRHGRDDQLRQRCRESLGLEQRCDEALPGRNRESDGH